MIGWIKKLVLKWVLGYIKGKIRESGEDVNIFMSNLYSMSMTAFMSYCMETLSKKALTKITFPNYLKELIVPLKDDVEEVIVQVIDGLDPRS